MRFFPDQVARALLVEAVVLVVAAVLAAVAGALAPHLLGSVCAVVPAVVCCYFASDKYLAHRRAVRLRHGVDIAIVTGPAVRFRRGRN